MSAGGITPSAACPTSSAAPVVRAVSADVASLAALVTNDVTVDGSKRHGRGSFVGVISIL